MREAHNKKHHTTFLVHLQGERGETIEYRFNEAKSAEREWAEPKLVQAKAHDTRTDWGTSFRRKRGSRHGGAPIKKTI